MEDMFEKIVELVKDNTKETSDNFVEFSDSNYKAFQFDKKNFYSIKSLDNKSKVAFVDGGSAEILKSANFSLSVIRVSYSIFEKNKKVKTGKKEFYTFTNAVDKDNEIFYNTELISMDELVPDKNDLLLSSLDDTLKQGITRASVSNMTSLVRRFSEIKVASKIVDNLEGGDVIVLDGSLQCTFTNEKKYLDELFDKAFEKGVVVSGLSKTTTLMTDKGNSIANALGKFNVDGKWCYNPVADIRSNEHKADISFVKLHEKSRYVFRFEIYKEQKQKLNEVVCLLAENCKDPVFIGYPYGLIEADRSARVSNNERDTLKTFFSVKFGKDWEKIKETLTSTDAHEILDKIS